MLVVERGRLIVKASPRVLVKENGPAASELVDCQPGENVRTEPETAKL